MFNSQNICKHIKEIHYFYLFPDRFLKKLNVKLCPITQNIQDSSLFQEDVWEKRSSPLLGIGKNFLYTRPVSQIYIINNKQ